MEEEESIKIEKEYKKIIYKNKNKKKQLFFKLNYQVYQTTLKSEDVP